MEVTGRKRPVAGSISVLFYEYLISNFAFKIKNPPCLFPPPVFFLLLAVLLSAIHLQSGYFNFSVLTLLKIKVINSQQGLVNANAAYPFIVIFSIQSGSQ
jgi:hypothetical protein